MLPYFVVDVVVVVTSVSFIGHTSQLLADDGICVFVGSCSINISQKEFNSNNKSKCLHHTYKYILHIYSLDINKSNEKPSNSWSAVVKVYKNLLKKKKKVERKKESIKYCNYEWLTARMAMTISLHYITYSYTHTYALSISLSLSLVYGVNIVLLITLSAVTWKNKVV